MMSAVTAPIRLLILLAFAGAALAQTPATPTPAPASPATQPPATQPPATQPPATEAPPVQPTLGDDKDSIEAGRKWLELLDTDKSGIAWDSASKLLQSVVKRDAFIAEMRSVRKSLGKLASRTPVKFARAHELPGAPTGDYAIIEYDAAYVNGKHLSEQVIWTIESGDIWRVAGYFYR